MQPEWKWVGDATWTIQTGDMGYTGYIGNNLGPAEWVFKRFEHQSIEIEVHEIIIHKTHKPDLVLNFFDAIPDQRHELNV